MNILILSNQNKIYLIKLEKNTKTVMTVIYNGYALVRYLQKSTKYYP